MRRPFTMVVLLVVFGCGGKETKPNKVAQGELTPLCVPFSEIKRYDSIAKQVWHKTQEERLVSACDPQYLDECDMESEANCSVVMAELDYEVSVRNKTQEIFYEGIDDPKGEVIEDQIMDLADRFAIPLIELNDDVWSYAIENKRSFSYDLNLIRTSLPEDGARKLGRIVNDLEQRVADEPNEERRRHLVEMIVAVRGLISLGVDPDGSLVKYRDRYRTRKDALVDSNTRVRLAKPPAVNQPDVETNKAEETAPTPPQP